MFLQSLSLFQFRNYGQVSFAFQDPVVGITGPNGVGKTNLLDAIHFLCFTRSYFSRTDAGSVTTGQQGFRIEGTLDMRGKAETIACILRETGKKEVWVDGEPLARFSSHIGRFPVVFIAPDDISLVSEGAEGRRKFLDTLMSQLDPAYLQALMGYQKILQQRNAFLRNLHHGPADIGLLDVLDQQLSGYGQDLYEKRRAFLVDFIPEVVRQYQHISGKPEEPALFYESQLTDVPFPELLASGRSRDLATQRTSAGVHRDEIEMKLDGLPFRQVASQGQRKSLLFALKLAEFEVLKRVKGFPPLLLMDDVFEKLDEQRMRNLLQKVCLDSKGQVFLTDTHAGRIQLVMQGLGIQCHHLELA